MSWSAVADITPNGRAAFAEAFPVVISSRSSTENGPRISPTGDAIHVEKRNAMAQKVQVLLVCDLHDDEVEASETVAFGLDGSAYEIDVCEQHGAELRDAFAPYVGAARRAGRSPLSPAQRRGGRGGRSASAGDKQRVQEIREWARANGHKVSERGRLSAVVMSAYEAAH
jgi:hypothetical protein